MKDYIIIEGKIKYILSSCPDEKNIKEYSIFLKNNNVKYLVNFCEKQYSISYLDKSIKYESLFIEDGRIPELNKLERWKELCKECIKENKNIALHCVSGMGRAPTMLCISLIEYENYSSIESIELIREKRKGCLNSKQLHYLLNYKKNNINTGCIIL
tara:strand:- start:135 stop:605 length:471 start_codon:yes stop_codon:yes gene_type:complete